MADETGGRKRGRDGLMSLRTAIESPPERRCIKFGGMGGLETTLSATTAFWLAGQRKRVPSR